MFDFMTSLGASLRESFSVFTGDFFRGVFACALVLTFLYYIIRFVVSCFRNDDSNKDLHDDLL